MSVYAVVQIKIKDVERFGKYQLGLRKIFPRSGGKMLVSEDAPCPHEVDGTQIPVHGDLVHAVQGQIRQPRKQSLHEDLPAVAVNTLHFTETVTHGYELPDNPGACTARYGW